MIWNKLGFVLASKYRKDIVLRLKERPKTPKELAKETSLQLSNVSSTLKDLRNENIVECLTPKQVKGKLYGLTNDGKRLINKLKY